MAKQVGSQGNQVRVTMSTHKRRDSDIRKHLATKADGSAYMRELIRADIAAQAAEQDRLDDVAKDTGR